MPELAAAYAAGVLANFLFLGFILVRIYLRLKQRTTPPPESPYTSHIILGGLCAALSWGGLFFFILVEVSLLILAKKERERKARAAAEGL